VRAGHGSPFARGVVLLLGGMLCALAAHSARAEDALYRFNAPIEIQRSAPFVRLALPASAYAHGEQAELRDLRIVDAAGERVPFALLAPRAARSEVHEQLRDAAIYALPPRPAGGKPWASPLEVTVQGERITVRPARGAAPGAGALHSPGWLLDLGDAGQRGEPKPDDAVPRAVQLSWSGPTEFSAGVEVELSDDLRAWRRGASGSLLALASARGPLTQPRIALPQPSARFVRLVWSDPAAAPRITGAQVVLDRASSVGFDPPVELVLAPLPAVKGDPSTDPLGTRALVFDLGGAVPLLGMELRLGSGTVVAPVRVQGRRRADQPWADLSSTVFYRIERDGDVSTAPPLALHTTQRFLRIVPDERSPALDANQVKLAAHATLPSLVFARQGREPFTLQSGSAQAKPSALPIATLVPALDAERQRFGQATLGAWQESETALRQLRSRERLAALRPWLLWAVLLAGVAGLGFMVWRLARGARPQPPAA
jgi:Protein of unknown function (DUF3999)